jgi:MSHA biogenesis protein MshL
MRKFILISSLAMFTFLTACAEIEPKPFVPSSGHINAETPPAGDIPELVTQAPTLPAPAPAAQLEKYTVVVNEVPVKELLFALARDAQVNVDIAPTIEGVVTINAIDQTLPQILDRVARQVDLRYKLSGDNLYIQPDNPFLRTYTIDYVNLSRETSSTNTVSTQIASTSGRGAGAGGAGGAGGGGGGGGSSGNTSTTDVTTESTHQFWARLVSNISAILGEAASGASSGQIPTTETVIPNPESGVISVRATSAQHEQIQSFVDQVLVSAKRQVLLQTTIVEVTLGKDYQAGIDWSFLNQAGKAGINFVSTTLAGVALPATVFSSFVIEAVDPSTTREESLTAKVSLLDEFGDTRILSSPQIMVLNNQTAMLKVVENIVYFEVNVEPGVVSLAGVTDPAIDTTAVTVPVGIVMAVTPQISEGGEISLNVRPTISRVIRFVDDPNPELDPATPNQVPQIAVREMESVLRLVDGQIGVLGGLMTDETRDNVVGLPGVKDLGFFGNLFKSTSAQYTKTELVIFLRPIIIRNPSLEGDLADYQQYLNSPGRFTNQEAGSEAK